jgi:DNA excision repair protein ERCC-1
LEAVQGSTNSNEQIDRQAKITEVLTMIKSINRTDVASLASQFDSFAELALRANSNVLSSIPGFGDKKVSRLLRVLNQPFVSSQSITSVRLQHEK